MSKPIPSLDSNKRIIRRENGRVRVQFVDDTPSLTEAHHAADCDVNNIIKKYKKTGQISHVRNAAAGSYTDLADLDFQTMQDSILHAKNLFEQVPAEIRNRFGHDPQAMIEFLKNPSNHEEAVKLGLMHKIETPKPSAEDLLTEIVKNTKTQKNVKPTNPPKDPQDKK